VTDACEHRREVQDTLAKAKEQKDKTLEHYKAVARNRNVALGRDPEDFSLSPEPPTDHEEDDDDEENNRRGRRVYRRIRRTDFDSSPEPEGDRDADRGPGPSGGAGALITV
jgi:hypothetical protein